MPHLIEINLLPEKVKKQKKIQMLYTYFILLGIVIVVVLIGIVWLQIQKIAEIDKEIKKIEAESASLKDKIAEVKKFNEMEEVYNKKKAILDRLLSEQSYWTRVLDDIGELIPPDMWLKSLRYSKSKQEGDVIEISGFAMSRVVIADFIKKLEDKNNIMDLVTAEIVEGAVVDKINAVRFTISFVYKYEM